jgi:hypothetical protein
MTLIGLIAIGTGVLILYCQIKNYNLVCVIKTALGNSPGSCAQASIQIGSTSTTTTAPVGSGHNIAVTQ